MFFSLLKHFLDQKSTMRSGFETTITPTLMDIINYAIMTKYAVRNILLLELLHTLN